MKKNFLIAGVLFFVNTAFAQPVVYDAFNDALSFSQAYYHLTARSSAMGGASGALKSDFGAIAVNPAAIATYKTSELTFTPEFYSVTAKTDYRTSLGEQANSKYRNDVNISNIGIVYSFQSRKSPTRYNIGFAYNKLNAFNTNELVQNINLPIGESYWGQIAAIAKTVETSGISQEDKDNNKYYHFVDQYKGTEIPGQKYLFDANGSPTQVGDVGQRALYSSTGILGEYALSFGVNLSEKVYIGVSAILRDATKSLVYTLTDTSRTDGAYGFDYTRKYDVLGLGFGGKLGVLILPVPELTIGISVQSPIFYSFTQRTEGSMLVHSEMKPEDWERHPYEPSNEIKYNLVTPLQATVSFSYAFQNVALVTFDYEMTPYAMTKYSNSDGDVTTLNENNDLLKESSFGSSVRLGGEFYVWKGLAARVGGGYHSAPSSYVKSSFNFGLGAGYNFGDTVVDLSYVYRTQKQEYALYTNSTPMETTYTKNFITLSLAYRF